MNKKIKFDAEEFVEAVEETVTVKEEAVLKELEEDFSSMFHWNSGKLVMTQVGNMIEWKTIPIIRYKKIKWNSGFEYVFKDSRGITVGNYYDRCGSALKEGLSVLSFCENLEMLGIIKLEGIK